jgi:hypothetical protein
MSELNVDVRFEQAAAHYKDSYDIHLNTLKDRNILFSCLLLCYALFLINVEKTSLVQELVSYALSSNNNLCLALSPFLPVLLWVSLMGITVRYFQLCLQVEKQYSYLHSLESELNAFYSASTIFTCSAFFTREGKHYLKDYPMFSDWMWFLYTAILPFSLVAASIHRIGVDLHKLGMTYQGFACLISYLVLVIACFSYISKIHPSIGSMIKKYFTTWWSPILLQLIVFALIAGLSSSVYK